ncbi:hypothetical protein K2173_011335 [Erythroxylum novogranatense]|uniref:K-box domain-containing protein n=1 Tax=Erythroxylum novogranatense TaxID=1862640 RepID=A0AAV8S9F7_9ROSI|nr:hypothetical protein K2173_011335 [Erythroxylum novogranatense]
MLIRSYSFCRMKRTLLRYNKCTDSSEPAKAEYKAEKLVIKEVDVLKQEIAELQVKQLHLLGKDLTDLNLKDLQNLEQQLSEGLLCVKDKKEQVLTEQLEQSRLQEQQAMLENATLRRQVEELRGFFPSNGNPVHSYLGYHSMEMKSSIVNNSSTSLDIACNCSMEKGDSDTTLHLGLPTDVYRKRKTPEVDSHSNDSENQMRLL